MKINPEVIRVHKGLSPCTFWVNGYFFLCEIFSILQVYSCEGKNVFKICCLCWNLCISVGKRIQPDSWITDNRLFSLLLSSPLYPTLEQLTFSVKWKTSSVLTARTQTTTAHEGWIPAQWTFTLESKAQRPCSIPPGSCSAPHHSTQSLWVQWVFSPLVSLYTTPTCFLSHST